MNSFTPNYNLDLYDVDDKPNLNDQYNDAMGKIDTELDKQRGDIVTAETAVNNLSTKVDGFDARIAANATAAATAQTTAESAVGMSQEAKDAADAAQSAADAAQSDVIALNTTVANINKANKRFNVIDYGGDPTGATDSTNAFKNAVAAAVDFRNLNTTELAIFGAEVYIPSGLYIISDEIHIPSFTVGSQSLCAITFVGDSGNSKIVFNSNKNFFRFEGHHAQFINLSMSAKTNGNGKAIVCNQSTMYITLENVDIYGFNTAIDMSEVSLAEFNKVNISDCNVPINASSFIYSNFNKLYLLSNDSPASIDNAFNCNFINCAFEYTGTGIEFGDYASVKLDSCGMEMMDDNGACVSVGKNSNVTLNNFLVARTPITCVLVEADDNTKVNINGANFSNSPLSYLCRAKATSTGVIDITVNGTKPDHIAQGNQFICHYNLSGTSTKDVSADVAVPLFKYFRESIVRTICCGYFAVTVIDITNNRECAFLISCVYNGVNSSVKVIDSSYDTAAGNIPFGTFSMSNTTVSFTPQKNSKFKFIINSLSNLSIGMR